MICRCGRTFVCDNVKHYCNRETCMCPYCHIKYFKLPGFKTCYPEIDPLNIIENLTVETL
jgi:hypothetical protein